MKKIRKIAKRISAEAILITETPSGAIVDFYRFDEDDGAEVYVAGEWRFNGNTLGGLQGCENFHYIDSPIPWYYVAAFWAMIGWAVCRMVVAL